MSTIQNGRAIEALLARLQGPCASGKLVVRALGADTVLEPGRCAVPFGAGGIDYQATAFVKNNPANEDGAWLVTAAGTLVDVETLQGGTHTNRDGGTSYRWDPPIEGIEDVSDAEAAGISGGAFNGAFAGLRELVQYKSLDKVGVDALFRAQAGNFPAALVSWMATTPLDGPLAGSPGPRTSRVSQRGMLYRHTWMIWLVTSRLDLEAQRRAEGDTLRDDALDVLFGAKRVRDGVFQVSMEPGVEVQNAVAVNVTPTSYIDSVTFTTLVLQESHPEETDAHPWLRTRLRQQTAAQPPYPPLDIPNIIVPMPPGGPGTPPFP